MSSRQALVEALFPHFRSAWILYEDADLIAIDKPSFLATHAQEEGRTDDARSRLMAYLRERGEEAPYLGIHQRLDKGTSGVLVFTRRKSANASLAKQFEGRTIEKEYLAAVTLGASMALRGELRHRVAPGEDGAMRVVARGGQEAVTRFEILRREGARALVRLVPSTGRTHQIRVQLAAVGAPVAGDRLYDGAPATRLMLHAAELSLVHPESGARTTFKAQAPPELQAFVARREPSQGDVEAILRALRAAADARYGVGRREDTTALRLANGAGDALLGVAVDLYGEHLVVSLGEELEPALRERVLDAAHALGARGVYLKVRPKHASVIVDTRRDEFAPRRAVRGDDAAEVFGIEERGMPLRVRLGDGLSTGVFLDQRDNRRRVRELAASARFLNLFSYTGAFTVAAALGGAKESVSVDASRGALAWARENLEAAGVDLARHAMIDVDAFAFLASTKASARRFDLVVVDPPSFATTKTSRFSAASDFKHLAELVFGCVAEGGRVLACTNHKGLARQKLRRQLHEAARAAGRTVLQMKDLAEPSDFPPEPGREAHLKSILVTLA